MTHSKEISQKDSHFRGHITKVQSLDQATAARNSMFQNFTNEHHITYAYSIKLDDEEVMTGNFDNKEIGGSKVLKELIDEKHLLNVFLCVTKVKNGPNIGPIRFDLIDEGAKSAGTIFHKAIQPVYLTK